MIGGLGGMQGFGQNCGCERVRVVYVPNLPKEWQGKRFDSEQAMLLQTNIRASDYPSEVVCK